MSRPLVFRFSHSHPLLVPQPSGRKQHVWDPLLGQRTENVEDLGLIQGTERLGGVKILGRPNVEEKRDWR